MRKLVIAFCVFLAFFLTQEGWTQNNLDSLKTKEARNKFALGFNLNQFQHDFGLGLNFTSPYFLKNSMAVRLNTNVMWLQHINNKTNEQTWSTYSNVKLGLIGVGGNIGNFLRLYGEGGIIAILPNSEFSDISSLGGYGVFGFEFFMAKNFNYYIELGGIGSGAIAEKIPTKPIYSNGFSVSVGFRVNL